MVVDSEPSMEETDTSFHVLGPLGKEAGGSGTWIKWMLWGGEGCPQDRYPWLWRQRSPCSMEAGQAHERPPVPDPSPEGKS